MRYPVVSVLLVFSGIVSAQYSGPAAGRSKTFAAFDPLKKVAKAKSRPQPKRRAGKAVSARERRPEAAGEEHSFQRPSIGLEEYLRRKAQMRRTQPVSGPPGVEVRDATGMRAPLAIRQPLAATPASNWEGIQQTPWAPPDPDIAAGPEDILLVVNSSIARYAKTGEQTSLTTFLDWFEALLPTVCPGGRSSCVLFDPNIRYDQLHGRFLLTLMASDDYYAKSSFLIAVSNGATFAGGWKNWALDASLNGQATTRNILDYPQVGFDTVNVYLTGAMFDLFNIFQYVKVRVLRKAELYDPATTTLSWRDVWDLKHADGAKVGSIRAAHWRGRTGEPGPGVLISASDEVGPDYLTLWRLNDQSGTLTPARQTIRPVWKYDFPGWAPQAGTATQLDTGDARVLKAVIRNGILYTARNTGYTDEPVTVTYDRIDLASNKVTLQARGINGNYFYPALDIPASLGPENVFPRFVFGTTTGPTGALVNPGLQDIKAGEDRYDITPRWGDYFGAAVDPVSGGMLVYWQYAKSRGTTLGRWGTWAAFYPWTTQQQFVDVGASNPAFHFVNVMRMWGITLGCATTLYCPADNVTRGQIAVFIIRAMMGDSFQSPGTAYFTDVPSTHPYFKYIQKMRELGITAGCAADMYCPDADVTRGQMAVFVARGKLKAVLGETFSYPTAAYFTDVPSTDPRFRYVQKIRELGITTGCEPNKYCPDDPVTREQMAVSIVRAFLN